MKKSNNPIKSEKLDYLRRRAEEALKKRTVELEGLSTADSRDSIQELGVYQIELEMQNSELRRTQLELEESRNKYSDLYNFAPVGYFTIDENGLILETNSAGTDMFGVERHSLFGKPFSSFIAPEDLKGVWRVL